MIKETSKTWVDLEDYFKVEPIECLGCGKVFQDDDPVVKLFQSGKEFMCRLSCYKCMLDQDKIHKYCQEGWFLNET